MEKQYLINTKRLPCAVNFKITTDGSEVPVYITGYDPLTPNTFYFKSKFLLKGSEEVTMNCPQSPRRLKVVIWSVDNQPFQIASVTLTPIDRPVTIGDPMIDFIEKFSRYAGVLRPGIFKADGVPFIIQLQRNIYRDDGSVHPTPARIHISEPVIQASQEKFNDMSVPERVIILLHEVGHNFINRDQDDEKEADQNALNIYNQLGYPKIEAVNAFGDIMDDTDDNYERMLNLVNM
jgi:hypothetical protein